jgi:hypothetical protein
MRFAPCVLTLVGACGFTPGAGGPVIDADGDGPLLVDADRDAPDAGPDAALGMWSTPATVDVLNGGPNDDDPALTSDMLEIVFASTRGGGTGGEDIWMATRGSTSDGWSAPFELAVLNSPVSESNVKISGDGLLITFASNRSPSQAADIWAATRPDRSSPFSPPMQVVELSSDAGEWHAHPSFDHLAIVMCSSRDGDEELYTSGRPSELAVWSKPFPIVGAVSSPENDCDPMMPEPTSELYFASARAGMTGYDLYVAQPDSANGFETPTPIAELNSGLNDRDPWVSPDRRTMYFTSARNGNGDEIFVTTR